MTDQLTRQPFIDLLKSIIANQNENKIGYSIAIDGEWGCGKTWVVNELENQLQNDYLVFHYNAWENDFYDEPLVAMLSVLIDRLGEENKCDDLLKKIDSKLITGAKTTLKIIAKSLIKNKTGIDADDVIDGIKAIKESENSNQKTKKDTNKLLPLKEGVEKIRKQICKLSEKIPVILVIDELDRCLPEYAIKVLERLHHICNETQIITIMAIEKNQIADSICKVFGKQLEDVQKTIFANRYLQKFIDVTIPLNKGKIKDYDLSVFKGLEKQFEPYEDFCNSDFLLDFYTNVMSVFTKREQEKILQTVELAHILTIKQGTKLENYLFQLLCLEILYGIRKCIFNNDCIYSVIHSNENTFYLFPQTSLQGELSEQYCNKLKNFTTVVSGYSPSPFIRDEILYISVSNPKELLLNYFLPNLTYTAADSGKYYVKDIQNDKAFLEVFIKTLDFTE